MPNAFAGHLWISSGWAKVRRIERALPHEYLAALRASLDAGDLERTRQIAEAAELVRGFESIKLHNVDLFRKRLAEPTTASDTQ